jgi:Flp pilus assembly protein TadB
VDILLSALVLIIATFGIGALCYSWMKSTRASQRKVEAQNERIIALLEQIASSTGERASPELERTAASRKPAQSERNNS